MNSFWWRLVLVIGCAAPAAAQSPGEPDTEGCRGSKLLSRMPGCPLIACDALSEARARGVVDWLSKNGVEASRLVAKGYGDTVPVEYNATEEGRAKNRRVQLRKLDEE